MLSVFFIYCFDFFAEEIPAHCAQETLGILYESISTTEGDLNDIDACLVRKRPLRKAKYYAFTLEAPSVVTINLTGQGDPFLKLYRDGESISKNNDGGIGRNAYIQTPLLGGTYTVEATTFNRLGLDFFTLSVHSRHIDLSSLDSSCYDHHTRVNHVRCCNHYEELRRDTEEADLLSILELYEKENFCLEETGR